MRFIALALPVLLVSFVTVHGQEKPAHTIKFEIGNEKPYYAEYAKDGQGVKLARFRDRAEVKDPAGQRLPGSQLDVNLRAWKMPMTQAELAPEVILAWTPDVLDQIRRGWTGDQARWRLLIRDGHVEELSLWSWPGCYPVY